MNKSQKEQLRLLIAIRVKRQRTYGRWVASEYSRVAGGSLGELGRAGQKKWFYVVNSFSYL